MKIRLLVIFSLLILISSCSKFRKIQKSEDWRVKYEAALQYYEKEDYYRAVILFEEILPIIRAMKEGEDAQFYYAYCHYYQRSYLLAAHYFKNFYQTYSRSSKVIEANFMHAYSLYMDSPIYNLDQTSTLEAISAMQLFINKYKDTEYNESALDIINQLQYKLETKAYENAKQYFKIRIWKSALIAFDNFNNDFPDSRLNEEINYLKIVAQYNLAEQSISSKQRERYESTLEYYQEFIDAYPSSEYLKDAERLYSASLDKISKIARSN